MSNPTFYFTDLSQYVYTADFTDAGHPLANLNDYDVKTVWASNQIANQNLIINFGVPHSGSFLIIDNSNLAEQDGVQLEAADNIAFTLNNVVVATNLHINAKDNSPNIFLFATQVKQFWRLVFADSGTEIPYIGNLFLDSQLTFESAYNYNFTVADNRFATVEKKALSGRIYTTQLYGGRKEHHISFKLQSPALQLKYLLFHQTVQGDNHPFYFTDTDGNIHYVFIEDYSPPSGESPLRFNMDTLLLKDKYTG